MCIHGADVGNGDVLTLDDTEAVQPPRFPPRNPRENCPRWRGSGIRRLAEETCVGLQLVQVLFVIDP